MGKMHQVEHWVPTMTVGFALGQNEIYINKMDLDFWSILVFIAIWQFLCIFFWTSLKNIFV